ncbi:general substrate transporter [Ramicandelaber brevisporus]|nr:general substrate transporter [Ramicandelaber brevisporus]
MSKRQVYYAASLAAIGGFLYGYDQGVMGSLLAIAPFRDYFDHPTATIRGLIVSAFTLGAFLGSLGAGPLTERVGRRRTIIIAAVLFTFGGILQTAAVNRGMLIAGRIISGLGVGKLSMSVPLFQSEIAPKEIRGRLISTQQFAITVGIAVSFWIDYGFSQIKDSQASWRAPLGLQVVPAVILGIGMWFMPESPRWLIDNGREDDARAVLVRLRTADNRLNPEVEAEFEEIRQYLINERETSVRSYSELFRPQLRRRTVLGLGIQAMQQLTGINVIMYYAPYIFLQAGLASVSSSLLAQGINGVINMGMTIPAILYVDRWGRRPTLMSGSFVMGAAYLVIGSVMGALGKEAISEETGDVIMKMSSHAAMYTCIVFVYVFVAGFAYSWGPVGWIYPAEIYPLHIRSKATSLTTASNWLFNFAIGQIAPILMESITWKLYMIFMALNWGSGLLVWKFYPETKGKSLEKDMDQVFGHVPQIGEEQHIESSPDLKKEVAHTDSD